ncbi:MAG TPA: hypothetical protein VGM62_06075 [Chthoniobacterales bacterium]|jgi:hypothetical protein
MQRLSLLSLIGAGALAIGFATAQTSDPSSAASLEPIAFLTTHEWDVRLPDSPDGKKNRIHARFTWAPSRQAIRISNEFVTDQKANPYIEGLYAWDPQQRVIVFWYVDAKGGLTTGTVKKEAGKLVHEFHEIERDGKTTDYVAKVTPHGTESWDNEIFAQQNGTPTPIVKVRYEIAQ